METEARIQQAWEEYPADDSAVDRALNEFDLLGDDCTCDGMYEGELCPSCQGEVDFIMDLEREVRVKVASHLLYYCYICVEVFDSCHARTEGGIPTMMEIFDGQK